MWLARSLAPVDPPPDTGFLSPAEEDRARRYRFPKDRDRFLARRWILRIVLAAYLRLPDPRSIQLRREERGRPVLDADLEAPLHFSLSSSGELVAVALSRHREIGVDVERIREVSDAGDIVQRYFSASEHSDFRGSAAGGRSSVFVDLWTRKEAVLKARGSGLTDPLDSVEVSVPPEDPRVVRFAGEPGEEDRWTLQSLLLPRGFAGTLALGHPEGGIRYVGWW